MFLFLNSVNFDRWTIFVDLVGPGISLFYAGQTVWLSPAAQPPRPQNGALHCLPALWRECDRSAGCFCRETRRNRDYMIHTLIQPSLWLAHVEPLRQGHSWLVVLVSEGSGTTRTPVRNKQNPKLTCLWRPEHLREASDEHEPCTNPTTQVRPLMCSTREMKKSH